MSSRPNKGAASARPTRSFSAQKGRSGRPARDRGSDTAPAQLTEATEDILALNEQLADKVQELLILSDDLANLLDSADIATVFLDTRLRVKRFTTTAAR